MIEPDDYNAKHSRDLAWQTGWNAAAYRKTLAQNPWQRPDLRIKWEAGWKSWHEAHGITYAEPT